MFAAVVNRYRQAFSGLPGNVWLMSFILLVNRSGTMMLPFLGLYLTGKLGLEETQFGTLLALYGIGGIFGAYLGGWLARRISSIRTMVLCMTLSVPFYFLIGSTTNMTHLAILLPLMALPVEAARPATTAATTDLCPRYLHTKALALNRLAVNLGMAIGPVIGGAVYAYGFIYLVSINAVMTAVSTVLLILAFRRSELPEHPDEPSARRATGAVDSPWRDPIYLTLLLINILTGLIFFQIMGTFSIYLRDDFGWTEFQLGILLAINTVLIVLTEMVLVDYVKQFNFLKVIGWGCLAVGMGFGVIAFSGHLWIAILSVLVWTVGEMLTMPLSVAFASQRSSNRSRSSYLAAYSMSFSICMVVAPLVGTHLYQWNHRLPWFVAFCGGPMLLLACYALAAWEAKERQQGAEFETENGLEIVEREAVAETTAALEAPQDPAVAP